ncbi:hypothetical protein CVS40_3009 [Lucilia cuprina]|nr:hypothetical protein CVS40_3009 [Lucilia cuprina]
MSTSSTQFLRVNSSKRGTILHRSNSNHSISGPPTRTARQFMLQQQVIGFIIKPPGKWLK